MAVAENAWSTSGRKSVSFEENQCVDRAKISDDVNINGNMSLVGRDVSGVSNPRPTTDARKKLFTQVRNSFLWGNGPGQRHLGNAPFKPRPYSDQWKWTAIRASTPLRNLVSAFYRPSIDSHMSMEIQFGPDHASHTHTQQLLANVYLLGFI